MTCASQAVNGERDDLAEIDLVSNPPIVDSVAVSYGSSTRRDARSWGTNTSSKITTPTDWPYLAENLSEASVLARACSNRGDLQPLGDGVASDLDTCPSRPTRYW